jgi:peptidoglycan/LPS O-acetylase OafA/YrhL
MDKKSDIAEPLHYCPALDGLRAVCIIFTIFNHVPGAPLFINGTIGVDIFFALSGFLITYILLDTNRAELRSYYIRRLFRIAPLYYLAFFATVTATIAGDFFSIGESRLWQLREIWLESLLFSRELVRTAPTLFGQSWTIGIEEKFYLLYPLYVIFIRKKETLAFVLIIILISLICLGSHSFIVRGYGGIIFGCLSCIWHRRWGESIPTNISFVLLIAAYFAIYVLEYDYENLFISLTAAIFIASLYRRGSRIKTILSSKPFVHLGKLTYSFYLFHVLIYFIVGLGLNLISVNSWLTHFWLGYLVTYIVCSPIYWLIEKPCIDYGRRLTFRN